MLAIDAFYRAETEKDFNAESRGKPYFSSKMKQNSINVCWLAFGLIKRLVHENYLELVLVLKRKNVSMLSHTVQQSLSGDMSGGWILEFALIDEFAF